VPIKHDQRMGTQRSRDYCWVTPERVVVLTECHHLIGGKESLVGEGLVYRQSCSGVISAESVSVISVPSRNAGNPSVRV
jgi:hypothetical protein